MEIKNLNKKYAIGLILVITFFIINYTASLSSVDINTFSSLISIFISILFIIFITKNIYINSIKINIYLTIIIWGLLFGIISLILNYNWDINNMLKLVHYFLLFVIIPFLAKSIINIKEYTNILLYSLILSGVLMIPLIFYNTNIYQFNNSGLGLTVVGAALIIVIFNSNTNHFYRIFSMVGLLVTMLAIAYINSRTSFLTVIALVFITILITKSKNLKKRFLNLLKNSTIIIILAYLLLNFFEGQLDSIINKFTKSYSERSILSSRDLIWEYTIEHVNLFGHGREFYTNLGYQHAHNTFIGILGVFGILVFLLFILYSILSLINSYKFYKYNHLNGSVYLLPFLINITFLILSFGEDLINHPKLLLITILYFLFNHLIYLELNFKKR